MQQALATLTARLMEARQRTDDSPVFQFLVDLPRVPVDHSKTDLFRDRVQYSQKIQEQLAAARSQPEAGRVAAILGVRDGLGPLADVEAGTMVNIFLALRAANGFEEMVEFHAQMPVPLQRNRMVREQLGLALNRLGRHSQAAEVLREIVQQGGPSPETCGILGRVYKDQYQAAAASGQSILARGLLKRAIDTYLSGFEADWREAYPGINAVTLMELQSPPDPRQAALLPVVRFAAERNLKEQGGDYWGHATLLELAVLGRDPDGAMVHLADAMPFALQKKEILAPLTTARNLRLIREKREQAGENCSWIREIEEHLELASERLQQGTT